MGLNTIADDNIGNFDDARLKTRALHFLEECSAFKLLIYGNLVEIERAKLVLDAF